MRNGRAYAGLGICFVLVLMALAFAFSLRDREKPLAATHGAARDDARLDPVPFEEAGQGRASMDREPVVGHVDSLEESSPSTPDLAPTTTVILVEDVDGHPIADADVHLYGEEGSTSFLGRTDPEGSLELEIFRRDGLTIGATRVGYAPGQRVTGAETGLIVVVLDHVGSITGQLSFGDAPLEREGISVVAVELHRSLPHDLRLLTLDDPELDALATRSDPEGRFSIDGLARGRLYKLFAGGDGYYSREATTGVRAGASDANVALEKVLACLVRFVDSSGASVGEPIRRWVTDQGLELRTDPALRIVLPSSPCLILSGIDPYHLLEPPADGRLILRSSTADVSDPAVEVSGQYLGYEPIHARLPLTSVESGITETLIPLRESALQRGSLHVRFLGAADGRDLEAGFAPVPGRLTLTDGDGIQSITAIHSASEELELVPCGSYQVKYTNKWLTFRWPDPGEDQAALVVSTVGTVLDIPVPTTGALVLDLSRDDGSTYDGKLLVSVGRRHRDEDEGARNASVLTGPRPGQESMKTGGVTLIERPPYRLEGLPAGELTLLLESPRIVLPSGSRYLDVVVMPHTTTRLACEIVEAWNHPTK